MKRIAAVFLVSVICLFACGKKRVCSTYEEPPLPPPVHLELERNGINITRDTVKLIKCYWYKGGIKTYMDYSSAEYPRVTYLDYYDEFLQKQVVDSFRPLFNVYGITMAQTGSNKFFLEYPDNKVDSIVLDGQMQLQTLDNNCVTTEYSYKSVLYHGAVPPIDSQMRKKNIYLTGYICDKPQ